MIQRVHNRLEPVAPVAVCPHCEFGNRPGSDFCGACGAPLQVACAACGTHNPPRFRFCGGCGASLESAPSPAAAGRLEPPETEPAERRQLTVMFCDLVGSTALSLALDPEEFREALRSYQTVCAEAIERFDGYVAQYLGDGVLGYFGWPRALENEAERAVRAGLRVVDEMTWLDAQLRPRIGSKLAVRIGIHTGVVVVGEVGAGLRRENLALGGTPNIAARLQALAQPNSVVVSGVTRRLVSRQFQCEDLGDAAASELQGTGSAFRVVGERQRPRGAHRTQLVGRDSELALLRERWDRAAAGEGQAVTIMGDAGIGKSHLIDEFLGGLGDASHVVLEGRCLPYYQNTTLYPFVDMLERDLRQEAGDDPQAMVAALRAMLERDGMDMAESLPLFGALLQLPVPDARIATDSLTERTRAALIRMVLRSADCCPLVLIIEDLHWADASTLELIRALMANAWRGRMLALFTARPEFGPAWQATDSTGTIHLQRLAQPDAERIIERVAGKRLPREVVQHIVSKTDGVPLFVEELCKMVLQSGLLEERSDAWTLTRPLPQFAIPDTLQDWLEARLDRLSTVKEVAQLGAMLGREFSFRVLLAVAHVDEAVVRHSLDQLV
jgi:class 3 adenylate cyclase